MPWKAAAAMATQLKSSGGYKFAAKDQGLVSDRAYHELRMSLPEDIRDRIAPLSAAIQERRELNKTINTIPIPRVRDCLLDISYSEDICLQTLTSFSLTRAKSLVRVVGRSSNPLLTDEFPTRFSTGVDTRISFKL